MIQSPSGESFSKEEAHAMCQECNGSMVAYGQLELWDELKRSHAGEPSLHKVVKKVAKGQATH